MIGADTKHQTLHDAMIFVLAEARRPMTAKELAAEINRRKLYKRKDGKPVPVSQIYARRAKHPETFYLENKLIGLQVMRRYHS
jgi:HB1, ASXL, restriction endonuclease HTH domain